MSEEEEEECINNDVDIENEQVVDEVSVDIRRSENIEDRKNKKAAAAPF